MISDAVYPFVPALLDPAGSLIRELFKYLSDPGMISFAGGYPGATLFDVDGIGAASATVLRTAQIPLAFEPGMVRAAASAQMAMIAPNVTAQATRWRRRVSA